MKKIIEGKEGCASKSMMMKHEKTEGKKMPGKMTGTKTLLKVKKK